MNVVSHIFGFFWQGLSLWWVALLQELTLQHTSGPKLIHDASAATAIPPQNHEHEHEHEYELGTLDEEDDDDELYEIEDRTFFPSFDEFDEDDCDLSIDWANCRLLKRNVPECTPAMGCYSIDDLALDEQIIAKHHHMLFLDGWNHTWKFNSPITDYIDDSNNDTFLFTLKAMIIASLLLILGYTYYRKSYHHVDSLDINDYSVVSIDDGNDDGDGDSSASNDMPGLKGSQRFVQLELSRLPSAKDLTTVQDANVLKYNGIPFESNTADSEEVDLINRSLIILSSPMTPPELTTFKLINPLEENNDEQLTPENSSPENLSRLSDELELASQSIEPIHLDDLSESIGPLTLDSANDLELEAITQKSDKSYDEKFGDHNVKVLFRISKVPKSRELNVTSNQGQLSNSSRNTLPDTIHTSDLEECRSDTASLFSGLTSSGLESCRTDYSSSNLVSCETESGNGFSAALPFVIHQDEPLVESTVTLVDDVKGSSPNPIDMLFNEYYLKGADDDFIGSSSGSTLRTGGQLSTASPLSSLHINETAAIDYKPYTTRPESPLPVTPTPTPPPSSSLSPAPAQTQPYAFKTHATPSSSSRIPVMSPIREHFPRGFKSSPIPKLIGADKPCISKLVEDNFFNEVENGVNRGEKFLCDVFGSDPVIDIVKSELESLTPDDIDTIMESFVGKETSQNWSLRNDKLEILIGHLRLHCPERHFDYFQIKISEALEDILLLVNTTRSKLLSKVIIFIRDLVFFGSEVALSNENFAILIHLLIPLTRASQASKHIQNLTIKSLCLMLQAITTKSLISNFDLIFKCILKEKKMKGEKYACLVMLKFYILNNRDKITPRELQQLMEKLLPHVPELSIDAYQKTRTEVVEIYLILYKMLSGDENNIKVDKASLVILIRYFDGLGSFLKTQVPLPEHPSYSQHEIAV